MSLCVVITSIQAPTTGVKEIAKRLVETGGRLVVVGDKKSPQGWFCPSVDYLSSQTQMGLSFATAKAVPVNSYSRKMLGYLVAASGGSSSIQETDDDNRPLESFFNPFSDSIEARLPLKHNKWLNIYSYFTDRFIWPRGFPLCEVYSETYQPELVTKITTVAQPFVLQAVADGDPDVDAIYRLTSPDRSAITFRKDRPLVVPNKSWTPFNSQATTWPISLLPLMYLPATCSFRMTDIWRSYIAQKLFPGLGVRLVVTAATVFQDRNEHDLMRDFRDEIEGYIGYERFVQTLEETTVGGTAASLLSDLKVLYTALISAGFFTSDELEILDAWLADMETLGYGPAA